jgi:hypothetical protein
MRKILSILIIALAAVVGVTASSFGNMMLTGVGKTGAGAPAFTGPGDVVSGALVWGSCARVYQASLASTSTSLCDLVAVTGGAVVCTLRGSSAGFVDLAASYCAGTTPSACAAASGGSCKVTKVYDQTTNGHHFTQATLANMPGLAFSTLNGLPGMTFTSAASTFMNTASFSNAIPVSAAFVAQRSANPTTRQDLMTDGGFAFYLAYDAAANAMYANNSLAIATGGTPAPTDSAFHALQYIINGASSWLYADGVTSATQNAGTNNGFATGLYLSSQGGFITYLDGAIMEAGVWATSFSAGNSSGINSNQHGTSGYNF